jgi:S-adenosylmethionine hydrolase
MHRPRPIFLFTDFGYSGPYVGQMTAAILLHSPGSAVVNLMHDAPAMRPELSAYLLAACCRALPAGSIVVSVVDPGVGGERAALVVEAPGLTLVGPDNGLMSRVRGIRQVKRIDWRPEQISSSFHGRDLFAPVAAMLAAAEPVATTPLAAGLMVGADWPSDLAKVVYIDDFGNLMTGLDAKNIRKNREIRIGGRAVSYAETFCRVPRGDVFWYPNSLGLIEIAANGGSATAQLSLVLGDRILLD